MPKYDIVVVGAGNAGMSAALQCQLAGKKTLLIEKHNLPGGAATSFVRGRFEIEPSLHEICDYGPDDNPGDVRNILDAYGTLNAAKMKVLNLLEEQLPIALYDTEWRIMSDKLNNKKYVSFTDSEKRIPKLFMAIYFLIMAGMVVIRMFHIAG